MYHVHVFPPANLLESLSDVWCLGVCAKVSRLLFCSNIKMYFIPSPVSLQLIFCELLLTWIFVQEQRMCWPVDIKLNQAFGTKMAGKQTEMIDNFC